MPSSPFRILAHRLSALLGPKPLRTHLVAIALVALLPALGVGAGGAWLAMGSYQRAFDNRLRDTARAVALGVRNEIGGGFAILAALAASPLLDDGLDGDLSAFHAHAHRVAETAASSIGLAGPDLRIRFDTDDRSGGLLASATAVNAARAAIDSRLPAVGDLVTSSLTGQSLVVLMAPVERRGKVLGLVAMRLWPDRLSQLLASPGLSGHAATTITDGSGVVVARSREARHHVGRRAPQWFINGVFDQRFIDGPSQRTEGLLTGRSLEGVQVRAAFHAIGGGIDWKLTVLEPASVYNDNWRTPLLALMLGGSAALTLALGFAVWLGNRVLRPISLLRHQAEAVAAGEGGHALATPSSRGERSDVAEFEGLRGAIGRAGEAMEASERRHRALAEAGAAALWRATPDGRILESRGWEVLTGQNAEELRGDGWHAALHPDDVAPTMAEWRRAMAERRPVKVEYRVRTRDGSTLWHQARAVPILDSRGEVAEWFGLVENIHDRKAAEAALAASEGRLRALVDAAPDAIVVMNAEGIIQSFNRGAESIFGHAAGEVIGRNASVLMPRSAGQGGRLAPHARPDNGAVLGVRTEIEGRRGDGSLVPLEVSVGEWFDEQGARHFTAVLRDVTERRAAEEKQLLLAREVDHRAKNALAVVQSLVRLTPAGEPKAYAAAVEQRVAALARAHSLLAQEGWAAADLRTLAEKELAAYRAPGAGQDAVALLGPPVLLAPAIVQPVAMVLHELTTNATKHGSLSVPGGRVELSWEEDQAGALLLLRWRESGGPPVAAPARRGFGSRLIEATVRGQLGGTVHKSWEVTGMVCEIAAPLRKAAHGGAPAA